MSNPTSNFGWQMPTNTDLVSQLPADFEVFGQAVDTSLADLKGGTTGQVLKKNTDTDMDFVWAADSAGMTNPMTTTGDTIYSSSGSTPARLGIGTTGQVVTVAGGVPTWATPTNAGLVFITGATFTSVSSVSLPTDTFSASYRNYQIVLDFTGASEDSDLLIRARVAGTDDTSSNYFYGVSKQPYTGSYVAVQLGSTNAWRVGQSEFYERAGYTFTYLNPKGTTGKLNVTGQSSQMGGISGGLWHSTVTNVDSMTFSKAAGTFSGVYRVYGLKD